MIDRSTAFWAWVWDNNPKHKLRRLIIELNKDGSCLAISDGYEIKFQNNERFDAVGYEYYERIPEPKKRLMTYGEVLGFIAWNPHIVVRFMGGISSFPSIISGTLNGMSDYEWAPITEAGEIGEWSKFEVTEGAVKKDGEKG